MIGLRHTNVAAMRRARGLALLLAMVIAIYPALGLAAAAHGYDIAPAGSHADHAMHLHGAMDHAGMPLSHDDGHFGGASGHHAGYDRTCCDACQIAAGLIVAAIEPVAATPGIRVVRLSEVAPA